MPYLFEDIIAYLILIVPFAFLSFLMSVHLVIIFFVIITVSVFRRSILFSAPLLVGIFTVFLLFIERQNRLVLFREYPQLTDWLFDSFDLFVAFALLFPLVAHIEARIQDKKKHYKYIRYYGVAFVSLLLMLFINSHFFLYLP